MTGIGHRSLMESVMKLPRTAALAAALLLPQPAPAQTPTLTAPGRIESAGGTMSIGSAGTGTIEEVLVQPWSVRELLRVLRVCRLYDYRARRWTDYDGRPTSEASGQVGGPGASPGAQPGGRMAA